MKVFLMVALMVAVVTCRRDVARVGDAGQTCDTMFCAMGKECVMEKEHPLCACIEKCVGPERPVCGSDGSTLHTFKSECHLNKASCERDDVTITLVAEKSCDSVKIDDREESKGIEGDRKKVKPLVCMEQDRDSVRKSIITWVTGKLNFEEDAVSYKGLLLQYFFALDTDKDQKLDTAEFTKIIEEDRSMSDILNRGSYDNPVLRGLCATEMIAITDVNSDYKLEFEEFHKCLDPAFEPPHEKCELGGVRYEEGEDVPAKCGNSCKCACGDWVCTQVPCKDDSEDGNRAEDKIALTEE